MDPGTCTNQEERSIPRKGLVVFKMFTPFKLDNVLSEFLLKMKKECIFQISDSITFEQIQN